MTGSISTGPEYMSIQARLGDRDPSMAFRQLTHMLHDRQLAFQLQSTTEYAVGKPQHASAHCWSLRGYRLDIRPTATKWP